MMMKKNGFTLISRASKGFTLISRASNGFTLISRASKGFTLMELLVVIAVLSVTGILVLYILTSSLRGNNRAQILSQIKKNGQAVLETIDKTVRNSDNVVCTSGSNTTLIVVKGGVYTRYRFDSNRIYQDSPETGDDETSKDFKNRVCTDGNPLVSPNTLVDVNQATGVSVINGSFTIDSAPGYKDIVTVKFTVRANTQAYSGIIGAIDSETFNTSIGLR